MTKQNRNEINYSNYIKIVKWLKTFIFYTFLHLIQFFLTNKIPLFENCKIENCQMAFVICPADVNLKNDAKDGLHNYPPPRGT